MLTIKPAYTGTGVFAACAIPAGTVLMPVTGKSMNFTEVVNLGDEGNNCLQVGINEYILPGEPFIQINHSCSPNSGINRQLELVSIKYIEEGEEIRWDYSTSMLERFWTMLCQCGSPECRSLITDFDLLPHQVQARYIRLEVVQPFILKYLSHFPFQRNGIKSFR